MKKTAAQQWAAMTSLQRLLWLSLFHVRGEQNEDREPRHEHTTSVPKSTAESLQTT